MNDETVRKRLFDISTQSQIGFDRQIQAMLQLGVERLGVEMGLLALLRADALELAEGAVDPAGAEPGGGVWGGVGWKISQSRARALRRLWRQKRPTS